MSDSDADHKKGDDDRSGRKKHPYFVDGTKYESNEGSITGAQIKAAANVNPTYQLFLEGKGGEPDRPIGDSDSVDLSKGAPHLYTAPPATFGVHRRSC